MDLFDFEKLAKLEQDKLIDKANNGDLNSQRKLARSYYLGWGNNESVKLGDKYANMAIRKGCKITKMIKDFIYTKDKLSYDTAKDIVETDEDAQYIMGMMCLMGRADLKISEESAKEWFSRASQTHAPAQYQLANLLKKSDFKSAESYFISSARSGFILSQCALGYIYKLQKDIENSAYFFTLAAYRESQLAIIELKQYTSQRSVKWKPINHP
eukprot:TRINITY_DN10819_c0_g1_i1.p1 TRINITY_DN10819_c0_g1~~TRINITY_DN10819_c0_g1_i1.p1  ORF type:complete len:213 (-),score=51.74 TRINITY_DN10819_c0_g1_i1:146-784(-)